MNMSGKAGLVCTVGKNIIGAPKMRTASLYKSVTLGRITKTKLSKCVGLSQIKWDLEKKLCTKRFLM